MTSYSQHITELILSAIYLFDFCMIASDKKNRNSVKKKVRRVVDSDDSEDETSDGDKGVCYEMVNNYFLHVKSCKIL